MPNQDEADNLNNETQPSQDGASGSADEAVTSETKQEVVLGKHKFNSLEDAGKSYEEAVAAFHRTTQEKRDMERRLAELEKDNQLSQALKSIADASKPKVAEAESWETFQETLANDFREDPAAGSKKLASTLNKWIKDNEDKTSNEIKSLKSEMQRLVEELRQTQVKSSPEFQENKEEIELLVAEGMPLQSAVKTVKMLKEKLVGSQGVNGRLMAPTGAITGSRTQIQQPTKKTYLSKEERQSYKAQGMTDAQLDVMETEYWQNAGKNDI